MKGKILPFLILLTILAVLPLASASTFFNNPYANHSGHTALNVGGSFDGVGVNGQGNDAYLDKCTFYYYNASAVVSVLARAYVYEIATVTTRIADLAAPLEVTEQSEITGTTPISATFSFTNETFLDSTKFYCVIAVFNDTQTGSISSCYAVKGSNLGAYHNGGYNLSYGWTASNQQETGIVYTTDTEGPFPTPTPTPTATPTPTPSPSPSPTPTPQPTTYTGSVSYLIAIAVCIIPAVVGFLTVGPWGFLIGLNVGVALGIVSFSAYVPVWAGLLMAVMDVAALLTSGLGGKGDIPK